RESLATPEEFFRNRRRLLAAIACGSAAAVATSCRRRLRPSGEVDPSADLYPAARNRRYVLERAITEEGLVTKFNNFFEFSSGKRLAREAQGLPIRPWTVTIDGLVEKPTTLDIDTLLHKLPIEERLYRHRCVEAWAMAVPWSGIPLKKFVDYARPLGSARYLRMETFLDRARIPRHRQICFPWPYVEGLTLAEATNELTFLSTGAYGKPLAKQNGSPLRLTVPWKYGFKSIKSIVRFHFTETRPVGFWERMDRREYGFWANVNPAVPHPRWSQETETMLGTGQDFPTQIYNGYGEFVADLYRGLEGERLFM
ncbi:MAG TPA: protein-methionine-sulfoxide reductase catalytic subunit MsrP, partial [Candidatus Binatia bacterium]|nr:protein-methionine-sulfoxide reductase catalytic subunit MsrP [Candidatus Binatia bacterium]